MSTSQVSPIDEVSEADRLGDDHPEWLKAPSESIHLPAFVVFGVPVFLVASALALALVSH